MNIRQTPPAAQAGGENERAVLSTFTGTKLDWLKCVAFDRRLKPYDFKVVFVIAQHLNQNTGSTMLSDETIADESAGSVSNVKRARVRLREAGWLVWHHTRTANVYRPDYSKMNYALDALILSREARQERRWMLSSCRARRARRGAGAGSRPP
jgi:hypothetical protein